MFEVFRHRNGLGKATLTTTTTTLPHRRLPSHYSRRLGGLKIATMFALTCARSCNGPSSEPSDDSRRPNDYSKY